MLSCLCRFHSTRFALVAAIGIAFVFTGCSSDGPEVATSEPVDLSAQRNKLRKPSPPWPAAPSLPPLADLELEITPKGRATFRPGEKGAPSGQGVCRLPGHAESWVRPCLTRRS
jgi:hypothetical protein